MKILFLTKYSNLGASSRYLFYQFYDFFEENGLECVTHPFLTDSYLNNLYSQKSNLLNILKAYIKRFLVIFSVWKYDLVVIEKEIFPYFPAIFEKIFKFFSIKYIVDYDDALFHQYDKHNKKLVRILLGSKIASVMKNASLVLAGNKYLSDYAKHAGAKNVKIIPTVIDINKYSDKKIMDNEKIIIGWIGSPSTTKYVSGLESVFLKLKEKYNIQISLIGASKSPFVKMPVEMIPWSEKTEVEEMKKFDIGIMPLIDNFWEKGKCGFKLIQYMGCALPVVGSPVGVNSEIIDHGVNGYLASSNSEWFDYLEKLIKEKNSRVKLGINGKDKVKLDYSKQELKKQILSLYTNVINRI